MTRLPLVFPLVLTACSVPALPEDLMVAVRASIAALAPHRGELPVDDQDLEDQAVARVQEADDLVDCGGGGVVSGVWTGDPATVFEGSWFELGTGDLGGTVDGVYDGGGFAGTATTEDEVEAAVDGAYADGLLDGAWSTEDGQDGELVGRYGRVNERGGYFFGLWTRCD